MKFALPIIKKELEVRSRSYSLSFTIMVYDGVLFFVALAGSFSVVSIMARSYETMYGTFLNVYVAVAALAYAMLLIIAPLYTAPAISGERETGTFDLLLTTKLSEFEIVFEKLASAFVQVFIIAVTGLPAFIVPLMFGGVSLIEAVILLVLFMPGLFMVLSAGMFASSAASSVTRSVAVSYGLTFGLTVGIPLLAVLARGFSNEGANSLSYLLALDPLFAVFIILEAQIGNGSFASAIFSFMGLDADPGFLRYVLLISVIIQLALGAGFFLAAVINVSPGRYGEKKMRKNQRNT